MHGAFHFKLSTARLYASRKEGGKGLHSIENAVRQEMQGLKYYVSRKAESGPLIKECKLPRKGQIKRQLGIKSLCIVPGTKVCQKLQT